MVITGADLARQALRALGVLDPIDAGSGELIADALTVASLMVDEWRSEPGILIPSVTRSVFSLASGTQTYTIGSGGTFNVQKPESILGWSVIPDDDATDVLEIPMGRPLTWEAWQAIPQKSVDGPRPSWLWYEHNWSAGLGNCHFAPIPDNSDVDVVFYSEIPVVTSVAHATEYNLAPAAAMAIVTNLAVELASRYPRRLQAAPELMGRAARSKANLWRSSRHGRKGNAASLDDSFRMLSRAHTVVNLYTGQGLD